MFCDGFCCQNLLAIHRFLSAALRISRFEILIFKQDDRKVVLGVSQLLFNPDVPFNPSKSPELHIQSHPQMHNILILVLRRKFRSGRPEFPGFFGSGSGLFVKFRLRPKFGSDATLPLTPSKFLDIHNDNPLITQNPLISLDIPPNPPISPS